MTPRKPKSPTFPDTIYVTYERDENGDADPFFIVQDNDQFDTINSTTECAVYQLVKPGRVTVKRTFEEESRPVERSTE